MHTIYSDTQYTNESKHNEMDAVRQNILKRETKTGTIKQWAERQTIRRLLVSCLHT